MNQKKSYMTASTESSFSAERTCGIMMKRCVLILLSAILLMFAGCTGDGESGSETETRFPIESNEEDAPVTLPRDYFNG